jgi:hypothetical protein
VILSEDSAGGGSTAHPTAGAPHLRPDQNQNQSQNLPMKEKPKTLCALPLVETGQSGLTKEISKSLHELPPTR